MIDVSIRTNKSRRLRVQLSTSVKWLTMSSGMDTESAGVRIGPVDHELWVRI